MRKSQSAYFAGIAERLALQIHECKGSNGAELADRITQLLTRSGFKLARQKKHNVWKHADGRVWTVAKTPSDKRGPLNNYKDLENFLKRGQVTGAFGLTGITDAQRAAFERTLHPVIEKKRKEVKERNIGIAIERAKVPVQVRVMQQPSQQLAEKPEQEIRDSYAMGRELHHSLTIILDGVLEKNLAAFKTQWQEEGVEQILRYERQIREAEPGWSEQEVQAEARLFVAKQIAEALDRSKRCGEKMFRQIASSATRIMQRAMKRILPGSEVQAQLAHACRNHRGKDFLAHVLFAVALRVLDITENLNLETPAAVLWDEYWGFVEEETEVTGTV